MAVAYDDSPSTHHALQFLVRSQLLKDISVDLIHVCEDEVVSEPIKEKLFSAQQTLVDAGYKTQAHIIQDEISDGIANYVTKNGIDLLMMGAYGHSKIRHLLIGSTTSELIRRCKISILLFR